jgi:signal transduction histidine kinase
MFRTPTGNNKRWHKGALFKKILLIFIIISFLPVIFSGFLTISTYESALENFQGKGFVSERDLNQLRENILIQIALVVALLVILIFVSSILVARAITLPLRALIEGAKRISVGKLGFRFKIKSKDELGDLAYAFNQMIVELKKQRRREKLVSRLKGEFISIAAHQLRTPLSTTKWILKMLLEGDFGPLLKKQEEFILKGYQANERMIRLVNDLLNVSRIEEGRFGLEFKRHDFNKFLKETVEPFKEKAGFKGVAFILKSSKEPLLLNFDADRLKMAVGNLISNAVEYTPKGGRIVVSVEKDAPFVVVSIRDTGVGIPRKQQDRVFSKFFRGDNVVRMQTEGTGLGLYLAKNIIEAHGGRIWFKSEEGKGTVFHFTLPLTTKMIPKSRESFEKFIEQL